MRISDWSSDVCSSDLVLRGDATHAIELRLSKARFKGVVFLRQHRLEEVRATADVLDPLVILAGQLVLVGGVDLELGLLLVGAPLLADALGPFANDPFAVEDAGAGAVTAAVPLPRPHAGFFFDVQFAHGGTSVR